MSRIDGDVTEVADFFEKGGAFERAWKARPAKVFPRAHVLSRQADEFEAVASSGKKHILVRGTKLDHGVTSLSFDVRGKRAAFVLGWILTPCLGAGIPILLTYLIRSRGAQIYGESEILPIVRERFPHAGGRTP